MSAYNQKFGTYFTFHHVEFSCDRWMRRQREDVAKLLLKIYRPHIIAFLVFDLLPRFADRLNDVRNNMKRECNDR